MADELGRMDRDDRAAAFRVLPKDRALAVFEDLDYALQRELLDAMRRVTTIELFSELDPDDRAGLLEELPAGVVARLLSGLTEHDRAMTTDLLGYPPRSAGRRMSPEVVAVLDSTSVGDALARIRHGRRRAARTHPRRGGSARLPPSSAGRWPALSRCR